MSPTIKLYVPARVADRVYKFQGVYYLVNDDETIDVLSTQANSVAVNRCKRPAYAAAAVRSANSSSSACSASATISANASAAAAAVAAAVTAIDAEMLAALDASAASANVAALAATVAAVAASLAAVAANVEASAAVNAAYDMSSINYVTVPVGTDNALVFVKMESYDLRDDTVCSDQRRK